MYLLFTSCEFLPTYYEMKPYFTGEGRDPSGCTYHEENSCRRRDCDHTLQNGRCKSVCGIAKFSFVSKMKKVIQISASVCNNLQLKSYIQVSPGKSNSFSIYFKCILIVVNGPCCDLGLLINCLVNFRKCHVGMYN